MMEDFCEGYDHDIFAIRLTLYIPEAKSEHTVSVLVEEKALRFAITLLALSYEVNLLQ